MKSVRILWILPALLAMTSLFTTGCNQTGCMDPDAYTYDPKASESDETQCEYPHFHLMINSVVGSQPFAFNQTFQINGVATSFTTAQFYLSGIEIGDDEAMEPLGTYLLVKANQTTYEVGDIKAGHKHMLKLAVGVDSASNFLDPTTYASDHPLAPKAPSMHWSWNSGYIFLRLEGNVDTDGDGTPETPFEYHVGGLPQYTSLTFDGLHADAEAAEFDVAVKVDWAKMFDGIDQRTSLVTHTMDNMPLARSLVANYTKAITLE